MVASHVPPTGTWPETQACALTGNQTSDPLVCRLVLNPLSHTSQGLMSILIISTYNGSHTVLGAGDTTVNKIPVLMELTSQWGAR